MYIGYKLQIIMQLESNERLIIIKLIIKRVKHACNNNK